MKEHPVIFNSEMVKAILDGRKTMTRRIVKPDLPESINPASVMWNEFNMVVQSHHDGTIVKCPYGKPSDRLWVRESFAWGPKEIGPPYHYKSDYEGSIVDWKWKPSIHMPRSASRITLEITGIRIERLQDISKEDCLKEGIGRHVPVPGDGEPIYTNYEDPKDPLLHPKTSFLTLWESINGSDSWYDNPWVWVLSFKKVG